MIWIYLLLILFSLLYLTKNYVFSYWKREGFPYIEPTVFVGNLGPCVMRKTSLGVNIKNLYEKSTAPIVGIYLFFRPALLICDAEIVKTMLTTDFSHFMDRGVKMGHPKTDPISESIFSMEGITWKNVRAKLSPTFTSGKIRAMIPTILKIGDNLRNKLDLSAAKSDIIDIKELCVRYGLDVIGTVAFGLDVNCIDDPEHSFRQIEKCVNNGDLINTVRSIGSFLCPELLTFLNLSPLTNEFKDYMYNIVKNTIEYRETNNIVQKDLLQFVMQLKSNKMNANANENNSEHYNNKGNIDNNNIEPLTMEQCAGQIALFYLAGFDTTSSTIAYCLYELARNRELMKRLQTDIDDTLIKHNGAITYDTINEITLLELCVLETIRKYPTLPLLNRICTNDYTVPNHNIQIKKGTPIIISLLGLFRDRKYFPEPSKFRPERFLPNVNDYNPSAFIPFGDGPRICIGLRLGKIVAKIALVQILQSFNIESVDDCELKFGSHSIPLVIEGGVNVRITRRTN